MHRPRDLQKALLADLEQIEDNAHLYRIGRESAYQAVAIQLRNLLLKGRRGLLGRVISQPMLHQFRSSNLPTKALESFYKDPSKVNIVDVRGRLRLSTSPPGVLQVQLEFTDVLLELEKWLDQWIIRPDAKLGSLIRDIANEEVAHTQDEVGDTIARTENFALSGIARERIVRNAVIVSIGEYITSRTREILEESAS